MDCPMCDGFGILLGSSGEIHHWRCRQCGWTFMSKVTIAPATAAEDLEFDAEWAGLGEGEDAGT